MIKERITNKKEKNMKQDFGKAIERLLEGIKDDYAKWGNDIDTLEEPQKSIRLKMIDEFKAQPVDKNLVEKFLKIQNLVHEISA